MNNTIFDSTVDDLLADKNNNVREVRRELLDARDDSPFRSPQHMFYVACLKVLARKIKSGELPS